MRTTYIVAHIPDELELPFLEHVRAFDRAHDGCHFEVVFDDPHASMAKAIDQMREAQRRLGLPLFGVVRK